VYNERHHLLLYAIILSCCSALTFTKMQLPKTCRQIFAFRKANCKIEGLHSQKQCQISSGCLEKTTKKIVTNFGCQVTLKLWKVAKIWKLSPKLQFLH